MKKLCFVLWLCLNISGRGYSSAEPILVPKSVVASSHDITAFTQGFLSVGDIFYESVGLYGQSELRKISIKDGEVLQSVALDANYFAEGIAILADRLYQLTWREGICFVYDLGSLELLRTFSYVGEGWGLTTDGEWLIRSDGSAVLTFHDPHSFAVVHQVTVSSEQGDLTNLNELEYMQGEILANVWHSDLIARISPQSGKIIGWLDLTKLHDLELTHNPGANTLNGIAYNVESDKLYVTGKLWSKIYELSIDFDE